MIGSGSPSDPFYIRLANTSPAVSFAAGRTPYPNPSPAAGERTCTLVGVGQSNIAASENATYSVINSSKIGNLNIFDGGIYNAVDPLLGTGRYSAGGLWMARLADKLITADLYDKVILAPIGMGSTTVADWAPGGAYNRRILVAARRCLALGFSVTGFLWAQGESDHGISQEVYAGGLASVINTPRSAGFGAPWFVGKSTYAGGATDANIRAAIDASVNGSDIFAGADTDSLGASYRHDGTHYNATGANAVADLWKTAIEAAT